MKRAAFDDINHDDDDAINAVIAEGDHGEPYDDEEFADVPAATQPAKKKDWMPGPSGSRTRIFVPNIDGTRVPLENDVEWLSDSDFAAESLRRFPPNHVFGARDGRWHRGLPGGDDQGEE